MNGNTYGGIIAGAVVLVAVFMVSMAFAADRVPLPLPVVNAIVDETNFEVAGRCSGTLIDIAQRLVLTAHHCVASNMTTEEKDVDDDTNGGLKKKKSRKFTELVVSQLTYNEFRQVKSVTYNADIVAYDDSADLAVVRIAAPIANMLASPIATSNPVRGEPVWIVGNPAMEYATLTRGNISSVHRQVEIDKKRDVLQVAGGLIGGNSGGAIYNEAGEIVGVAHAMRTPGFLGYIIPASVINKFIADNKAKLFPN